jgi:SAM-dependent methyltransferase
MYIFDNAATQTRNRLNALSEIFDPGTIRHLQDRGVRKGWNCLEVGGGGGSIVHWLTEAVGVDGSVLTTDLDTRLLEDLRKPNVEVLRHDICTDPLPASVHDLVHARLVLSHVADKAGALARMATALKPGGWMVLEDFEVPPEPGDSNEESLLTFPKVVRAMRHVLRGSIDAHFGRTLGAQLRTLGFVDIEMEGRLFVWRSGGTGASLMRLNCEQLRAAILATGQLSESEFEADLMRLDQSTFDFASPIMWTSWGRKPIV